MRVLVTGVSRFLGARVASLLRSDPGVEQVIGVDDITGPDIARVISAAEVDTVVHLNLVTLATAGAGSMSMKEINVIGTMQLLAACQRAPGVRKLVVRSSAGVYGTSPGDPAMFTEKDEPIEPPSSGYAKDATEIEGYVRGLCRRRPDMSVSVLRFANFLGPGVDSPVTRYFAMPVVPTVLGFDPRLQFVHVEDGAEVLRRMTVAEHPGVFNVAGDGVLLLSQAVRRTRRPTLPVASPLLRVAGQRLPGMPGLSPHLLRWLTYGRVLDTAKLSGDLTWQPKYSTESAFADGVLT